MAKEATKVSEATGVEDTPEIVSEGITVEKFFQLYAPGTDKYMRAYNEETFRGIMKSKESWKAALNLMEDEK